MLRKLVVMGSLLAFSASAGAQCFELMGGGSMCVQFLGKTTGLNEKVLFSVIQTNLSGSITGSYTVAVDCLLGTNAEIIYPNGARRQTTLMFGGALYDVAQSYCR